MRNFILDGVQITTNLKDLTDNETREYISFCGSKLDKTITALEILSGNDNGVELHYTAQNQKFERIRRITGYLSGDLHTWNNAKRSEERERVKHCCD